MTLLVCFMIIFCGLALLPLTFPVLNFALTRLTTRRTPWDVMPIREHTLPPIEVVIPAHNEEAVISRTLQSVLTGGYPLDKLRIWVVCDGCTDGTRSIVEATFSGEHVRTIETPQRLGKNRALNWLWPALTRQAIVLLDAAVVVAEGSLQALLKPFADSQVMVASAQYRLNGSRAGSILRRIHNRIDHIEKWAEGRRGALTSAFGPLMAIRRESFTCLPPDVPSDYYLPLEVLRKGGRSVYVPEAMVFGYPAAHLRGDAARRRRVVGRAFRFSIAVAMRLLRSGRLYPAFCIGAYKIPYTLQPVMIALGALCLVVINPGVFGTAAILAAAFVGAAWLLPLVPAFSQESRTALALQLVREAGVLQLATLAGLWDGLVGNAPTKWEHARAEVPTLPSVPTSIDRDA